MKVRLLVSRSGSRGAQNAGDEIDVSNAEGIRMIQAKQAVPVREDRTVETTDKPARKATRKRSR